MWCFNLNVRNLFSHPSTYGNWFKEDDLMWLPIKGKLNSFVSHEKVRDLSLRKKKKSSDWCWCLQIFLFGRSKPSLQPADIKTPHIKANIHPSWQTASHGDAAFHSKRTTKCTTADAFTSVCRTVIIPRTGNCKLCHIVLRNVPAGYHKERIPNVRLHAVESSIHRAERDETPCWKKTTRKYRWGARTKRGEKWKMVVVWMAAQQLPPPQMPSNQASGRWRNKAGCNWTCGCHYYGRCWGWIGKSTMLWIPHTCFTSLDLQVKKVK